jgi:hypothetical protein
MQAGVPGLHGEIFLLDITAKEYFATPLPPDAILQ